MGLVFLFSLVRSRLAECIFFCPGCGAFTTGRTEVEVRWWGLGIQEMIRRHIYFRCRLNNVSTCLFYSFYLFSYFISFFHCTIFLLSIFYFPFIRFIFIPGSRHISGERHRIKYADLLSSRHQPSSAMPIAMFLDWIVRSVSQDREAEADTAG